MSLWGNTQNQNAAPKSTTFVVDRVVKKRVTGTGNVATTTSVADLVNTTSYNNTTIGAFTSGISVGTFGVSQIEAKTKNSGTGQPGNAGGAGVSPGWVNMKVGSGPVIGATAVLANTANFANGETVNVSNGTSNATLSVLTNSTGNIISLSVVTGGAGFSASYANLPVPVFNRQKHLNNIVITSNATAIGYNNTDVISVSNATVNATATLTTNGTGGITATTITNPGLWANTAANSYAVFTISNSTGGATSGNVASTVFAANLSTSSNTGAVLTIQLGGRANRIQYENLVYMRSMQNNSPSTPFPG